MKYSLNMFVLLCFMIIMGNCTTDDSSNLPFANCMDGIQNGSETGLDCGGPCSPCELEIDIPKGGYESPQEYEGYNLVWSDEFNNSKLDPTKWSFHLGDGCPNLCGWGNNELQYYTDNSKNLSFKDGNLVITAINENINGYPFSSSRIHTDNKLEFKFGRIDIRASMPSAMGTWVAFWLLNKDYIVQKPGEYWPSGGEIDIMEYLGQDHHEVMGTAHFGKDFPTNHRYIPKKYKTSQHPFNKAFYVFSIIWEEDKIQWLVNDEVYHEITPASTSALNQPYPFNDDFFLLMNLSVGGNLPKPPVAEEYPANLIIDYIRVFQK